MCRYLVLFGDGVSVIKCLPTNDLCQVLSWYKSKHHCVKQIDQPMESIDLMEICSITNDGKRSIQCHTINGNTINLRVCTKPCPRAES